MGTLQSGASAGQRVKSGDTVLDRAKSADTRAVKKRVDALRGVHREYTAAHGAAGKANAALVTQQRKVGELDDAQDRAVEAWAAARVGAGAKRLRPFEDIGGPGVSDIQATGQLEEARLIQKLAAKDKKHPDAKVKKAAAAVDAAARAVIDGAKPLVALVRARDAAVSARDGLGPRWEKAFASLKRGARAAEDDGANGVFAALFDAPARPAKKKPPATNGAPTA